MLTLPIKKRWFDKIISGEKKEEYREIKPYYTARFQTEGLLTVSENPQPTERHVVLLLRNGYGNHVPSAKVEFSLKIKSGNPEWGAEPNTLYYTLCVERILSVQKEKKSSVELDFR